MKLFLVLILFSINTITVLGNNLALPCYGCHNVNNNTNSSSIPSLQGIDRQYFKKAFNEYKNKIRDNYLMQIISQGYSETDIQNLAEYFSNKEIIENDK
jgi:cytochrome c553